MSRFVAIILVIEPIFALAVRSLKDNLIILIDDCPLIASVMVDSKLHVEFASA